VLVIANNISVVHYSKIRIENLEKEMKNLQAAVSSAAVVTIINSRGRISNVNGNFEKITGYTACEIIGKRHFLLNTNKQEPPIWNKIKQEVMNGRIWRGELKHRAKNGGMFWTDTHIVPILDDSGNVASYYCISAVITDKKLLDEKLRASKNKLQAFFDSSAEACVLLSRNFSVMAFNKTAEKLVASLYDQKLQEGACFTCFCSSELQSLIAAAYPKVLSGESVLNAEMKKNYTNGTEIIWNLKFLPARDADNNIIGMAMSVEDVTQYKIYEATIIEQNKKLREIAWNNSHVLRSPLTNIQALFSLLKEEQQLSGELVDLVTDELNRLNKVICAIAGKARADSLEDPKY
jgi:PAS domain S-box-containing protein